MQFAKPVSDGIMKMEILVERAKPILAYRMGSRERGARIVITAGIHGCEYVGIQTVRTLLQRLEPEKLRGEVILIPLANEEGFYEGSKQIVPSDGKNLNRCFPGTVQGTVTERMAAALEQALYPETTFLIDLHGGDVNERLTPLVFYPMEGKQSVIETAKEAAKKLSVPYRVASSAKTGLYSRAVQCGVPAVLLERGCQGVWSEAEVEDNVLDIFRILEHFRVLDAEADEDPATERQQIEVGTAEYIEAESEGFWYPAVTERMGVKPGDLLGTMTDLYGNVMKEYRAQFEGFVMYYTLSLGVKPGTPLAAVAKAPEGT